MAAILEFDESTANSIANALGSNTFLFTDASQIPAHMSATGDPSSSSDPVSIRPSQSG